MPLQQLVGPKVPIPYAGYLFAGNPSGEASRLSPRAEPEPASSKATGWILLVEDNPGDVLLVRESLEQHGVSFPVVVITDGETACRRIDDLDRNAEPCPVLVVLDLNLPKRSGREVLSRLRNSSRCSSVPIVILSSSAAAQDIQEASSLGANDYIQKPLNLEEFMSIGLVLKGFITGV